MNINNRNDIVIYDPVTRVFLNPKKVVGIEVASQDVEEEDVRATHDGIGFIPLFTY